MADKVQSVSREEYLKRYLSKDDNSSKITKRRKAKQPVKKPLGLRIVDNDEINFTVFQSSKNDIEDDDADEKPLIAEIVDERPQSVKILEQYDSTRWKRIDRSDDCDVRESRIRTRHDSDDSDCSPVRADNGEERLQSLSSEVLNIVTKDRHDSDSDFSPIRRERSPSVEVQSVAKMPSVLQDAHSDSDLSPPRKTHAYDDGDNEISLKRHIKSEKSPTSKRKDSPRMLSGSKAGLQDAFEIHDEAREFEQREKEHLWKMGRNSGQNAKTIYRDRQTGKVIDQEEERQKKEEAEKLIANKKEKYAVWGKGIEQQEAQAQKFESDTYEMTKPLARYKDDKDLDQALREQEREGDPMLAYMKKKKQKIQPESVLPRYSGPAAPPNRFGIEPGYRWDGVDRSNGFEKKYFEKLNSIKSKEVEMHLWSVQDM